MKADLKNTQDLLQYIMSKIKKFIPKPVKKILRQFSTLNLRVKSLFLRVFGKNDYSRITKSMRVSIFGSCRQDSIIKNFKVTQIRDGLTYPHYTKEVIQAINYIKSKGTIRPKNLAVFRNTQLGKKILSIKSLHKQFEKTDMFVVEIASRISYEFEGDYYHHEIHDNPKLNSDLSFGELSIEKRIQTDYEIQEDMKTIKNLLAPKPVLFVTHFCSYNSGQRAELRDLIVSEAGKLGLRVFDPSNLMNNYSLSSLTINELVVNHFSKFAHEILAGRYQLIILEEILLKRGTGKATYIDQVLDSTPLREKTIGRHGFGDCGFGLIFLYRQSISLGKVPRINMENYFARIYLEKINGLTPINYVNVEYIFHDDSVKKFALSSHIFTNKRPVNKWDNRMRDFFLTNLLTPNDVFKQEISEIKSQLNLESSYSTIHIRFGDNVCKYNGVINADLERRLLKFLDYLTRSYTPSKNYLVLSDSEFFNKISAGIGYKSRQGPVGDRGIMGEDDPYQKFALIDFMLLCESRYIHHVSYNYRVSGFSELAALVYDVPYIHDLELSKTLKEIL